MLPKKSITNNSYKMKQGLGQSNLQIEENLDAVAKRNLGTQGMQCVPKILWKL